MEALPFEVRFEIEGWKLFWAHLETQPGYEGALAAVAREVAEGVRGSLQR